MTPNVLIAATSAGRIRLRTKPLKNSAFLTELEGELCNLEGVMAMRSNPAAASLIVEYDLAICDQDSMEKDVENAYLRVLRKNRKENGILLGKATKIGMAASLSATLYYGFAGKKRLHINAARVFVGFTALHMLKYSRRLFT